MLLNGERELLRVTPSFLGRTSWGTLGTIYRKKIEKGGVCGFFKREGVRRKYVVWFGHFMLEVPWRAPGGMLSAQLSTCTRV